MDFNNNDNLRNSRGERTSYYIPAILDDIDRNRGIEKVHTKFYSAIFRSKWSIAIWFALLAQAIRGTTWVWLYFEIAFQIPHTFAWQALLSQFGSFCEFKTCNNYKENCSKELPCPFIPLLFACLSAVQILMICCIMIFERFTTSWFLSLKYIMVLEILLFFFVTPTVTTLFVQNIGRLNATMTSQFHVAKTGNGPNLWHVTQHTKKCCGIKTYMDWDLKESLYPESCCDTMVGFCSDGNVQSEYVWKYGCYKPEYDTIIYYSVFELTLLGFGMIVLILQHYFVRCYWKKTEIQRLISQGEGTQQRQDLIMQQGSNFISLSRESKTMSLVQVNNVSIKITGVDTVAIIDSIVSMQICNYSSDDQILLSREVNKILVTVKRNGVLRGCVKITAPNFYKLQCVRVATNSRGTITVQTTEPIYDNI